MSNEITFTAKIDYIVYWDEKSSWGVLEVSTNENIPHSREKFDFDLDTNQMVQKFTTRLVGNMPTPNTGAVINVTGFHEYNTKFKKDQITVTDLRLSKPKTANENIAYLKSIVTERQAESLLSVYPNIVDDIISGNDKVDLSLLYGIGQATYNKIRDKVVENFAISDILSLLVPLGVSFSKISKLMDDEKNPQILKEKILNDPYFMVNISGISFKVADKIAIQLNPNLKKSEKRLIAFIKHYLNNLGEQKGDTKISIEELKNEIITNITECHEFFNTWIEKEKSENKILYIEDDQCGLRNFYSSERFIFNCVKTLNETKSLEVTDEAIENGIKKAEKEQGFEYTSEQKEVIIKMLDTGFATLSGKAGVGKSTAARGILKIYQEMGYTIKVAAFSAKSAVRASQTTGLPSSTIHRLLGLGRQQQSESEGVKCDVLFIDEAVLNPLYLMKAIFSAIDLSKTKLILCADVKQLPPLGVGNVFSDLLNHKEFNHNELTEIQRQAADSGIIVDANMIREGISPINTDESKIVRGNKKDLFYIFKNDKEELFRIAISSFLKSAREKGVENVVILVPFRKKSLNSTSEFNRVIQKELNSENKDVKFVHGKNEFWLNDFVIHVRNDYDKNIFNGETGFVTRVESNKIYVEYRSGTIEYTHDDCDDIELAYSLSTWKYQGSEVKDVIIVMDSSHFVLLSSQFLYCSLTRAKERALILSDRFAFKRCLEENKTLRKTWLKEME